MVKTKSNAGRPSKVDVWGLADEIDELRSKGLSHNQIQYNYQQAQITKIWPKIFRRTVDEDRT